MLFYVIIYVKIHTLSNIFFDNNSSNNCGESVLDIYTNFLGILGSINGANSRVMVSMTDGVL